MQLQALYAEPGEGVFYSPFNLSADYKKRLFLADWRKGKVYKGLEIQFIDDDVHGRGLLVLLAHLDGKVDVYFEPSLTLDRQSYSIGAGLNAWTPTTFERARFEIGPAGADVDVAFNDLAGRHVVIRALEHREKPAPAFALLAPMGVAVKQPEYLPLFWLYHFSFARRRSTELTITIDGEPCRLIPVPLPLGGEWVYIARYCGAPVITFWNKAFDGQLTPISAGQSQTVSRDGVEYRLSHHNGHPELVSMTVRSDDHTSGVTFTPPFPDAAALKDGAAVTGAFVATSHVAAGQVTGVYEVQRTGNEVRLRLHPSGGWQPGDPHRSARLVFSLLRFFKQWPKTYEWNGVMTLGEAGQVRLRSGWRRIP
ncbi:MAG: hypothetical protein HZC41_26365 [Chloroflexi bacterium]|nr:hypothetical protein [Chloroflexota bacterium]